MNRTITDVKPGEVGIPLDAEGRIPVSHDFEGMSPYLIKSKTHKLYDLACLEGGYIEGAFCCEAHSLLDVASMLTVQLMTLEEVPSNSVVIQWDLSEVNYSHCLMQVTHYPSGITTVTDMMGNPSDHSTTDAYHIVALNQSDFANMFHYASNLHNSMGAS